MAAICGVREDADAKLDAPSLMAAFRFDIDLQGDKGCKAEISSLLPFELRDASANWQREGK